MPNIIVVSGHIAAGKSSLTRHLADKLGFLPVHSRQHLQNLAGKDATREQLQKVGQELDQTNPGWMADLIKDWVWADSIVLDAVRRISQVESIRAAKFGSVFHVHLTADTADLVARFEDRHEVDSYHKVMQNATERAVDELEAEADMVIDTSKCTAHDTFIRVAAAVSQRVNGAHKNVDVLVGGQYGSEGKGHIAAHLAPEYDALIRVGGPNAGHTVIFNGKKVSFYHLPSGILHSPQAAVILGAGININAKVLAKEIALAESLGVGVTERLFIDKNANLITDEDIEREAALVRGIGSTGQGVGQATAGRILERGQRKNAEALGLDFPWYQNVVDAQEMLEDFDHVMLEGTQGTGLSLYHGPYPYVTSRDTTAAGTMADAGIAPGRIRKVIMVVRSNPIRVQSPEGGSSGPMSREISWEDVSERSGVAAGTLRELEKTTTTKRLRRVSEFDWSLLYRSSRLNLPTDLALTFADYISPENTKARRFEQLTRQTQDFIREVEAVAGAPVSMVTTRCHERSILDRRNW